MNKKHFILLCLVCLIASFFTTGCAWIQEKTRIKPAEVSPFIEHRELLVKQEATFPFHYFYLKKDAGTYENIYIAPVNTTHLRKNTNWAKLDQEMAAQLGNDITELANFMQKTLKSEFTYASGPKTLRVVDSPNHPKTLILESAIVAIVPTKAELNLLGTAANIFLPGIGVLTGKLATGSITTECMFRDAQTKEIIAMYADTEKDQHAILNLAGLTWCTSAKNNIRKQADYTARIFSGTDYSYMRRRLIKIIEL